MTKFPAPTRALQRSPKRIAEQLSAQSAEHRTRREFWELRELLRCADEARAPGLPVDVVIGQNPPGREPRGCCDAFRKGPSRERLIAWGVPIATALAFNVSGRITPYVRDLPFTEVRQTAAYQRAIALGALRILAVVARLGTQLGRLYACGAYARDAVARALSMSDARHQRLHQLHAQGGIIGLPHPSPRNATH